jgi:hypothetical protein
LIDKRRHGGVVAGEAVAIDVDEVVGRGRRGEEVPEQRRPADVDFPAINGLGARRRQDQQRDHEG